MIETIKSTDRGGEGHDIGVPYRINEFPKGLCSELTRGVVHGSFRARVRAEAQNCLHGAALINAAANRVNVSRRFKFDTLNEIKLNEIRGNLKLIKREVVMLRIKRYGVY